jgi:hypothetical protein
MSDKGSMEGSDNPMEIINYIAIQAECSKDLAQLSLMAVSGWDGESNGSEVKGLSSFADKAVVLAKEINSFTKIFFEHVEEDKVITPDLVTYCLLKTINHDGIINEKLAITIVSLTKDIITSGGLPEDWVINPKLVATCLIKTMNPDETLNKDLAADLAFRISIFITQNPRFDERQYELVDTIIGIMHNRSINLDDAMNIAFARLRPPPPRGGKSKKSKSKKYNRKSRAKKHNKRSKSKKIRKP